MLQFEKVLRLKHWLRWVFHRRTLASYSTPKFSYQGKGLPSYKLTNTGAEIRRCEQRIEELSIELAPEQQINIEENGFKLFESAEDNRICFQFEGNPSEDVRRELKSRAFKWSPSHGLWVRQLNINGRWAAKHTVEALRKLAAK